eukprot:403350497
MKPLLILKINVGQENGGVIPLKIYQNDEAYFNKITDSLFELFPTINTGSQIKKVLIDQIKEGIQEAIIEKEKRKEKRQQQKVSKQENHQRTFEQRNFDSIMKKESSDNDQVIDDQQFNTFCVNSLNNQKYDNQQLQQQNMKIKQENQQQNLANQDHNNLKIKQHTQSQQHDQLSNRTFDVDKKYNHHQTYTIAVNSALYSPMILEQRQFEEDQEIDQELLLIQNNQQNHQGIQVFRVEQQHVNFKNGQAQQIQNSQDSINQFKVNNKKHSKSNSLNLSSYKPFQKKESQLKLNDKDVLNYNLPFSPNASTLNPTTEKTTINNTNRGSPTNMTSGHQNTTTFNHDSGVKMEIQITEDSDNTISTSNICSAKSQVKNQLNLRNSDTFNMQKQKQQMEQLDQQQYHQQIDITSNGSINIIRSPIQIDTPQSFDNKNSMQNLTKDQSLFNQKIKQFRISEDFHQNRKDKQQNITYDDIQLQKQPTDLTRITGNIDESYDNYIKQTYPSNKNSYTQIKQNKVQYHSRQKNQSYSFTSQTPTNLNEPQTKQYNGYKGISQNKNLLLKQKSKSRSKSRENNSKKVSLAQSSQRLFNQSKIQEEKLNYKRDQISRERQRDEKHVLTFKPEINKKTDQILTQRHQRRQDKMMSTMASRTFECSPNQQNSNSRMNSTLKVFEMSVSPANISNSSKFQKSFNKTVYIEEIRSPKDAKHTFQPQILKKSARMVEERRKMSCDKYPVHEQLYKNVFEKERKLQKLKEQQDQIIEFQNMSPLLHKKKQQQQQTVQIGNNIRKVGTNKRQTLIQQKLYENVETQSQDINIKIKDENDESFVNDSIRQQQHAQKLLQYKEQLNSTLEVKRMQQKYQLENFDEHGQQLFKPKITRGPIGGKDQEFREKLDICTRMYYFMYVKQEKQKEIEEREFARLKDKANQKWMTSTSQKIFEKMQIRKLKELFDIIDNDKDGEISENSFVQAQLTHESQQILRPLIKMGRKLDFNEFLEQLQEILSQKRQEPITQCLFSEKKRRIHATKENYSPIKAQ